MAIEILRRRPPSEHIVTDQALNLIKGFEGLQLKAYPDPASHRGIQAALRPEKRIANWEKLSGDPWTIGWGHTKGVKDGDTCTLDQAKAWLREDAEEAAQIVRNSITVPLTPGEFAALTSKAFNFGYIAPSLRACLNGGITDKGIVMQPGSYAEALLQFPRNCRANGKPMKGTYRRRLAEACVFLTLPWENACSLTVIRFALDARGEIDETATTSLEDTIMRARADVSQPLAEFTPPSPAPMAPPPVVKDKLVLDKPAPPETALPDDGPAEAGPVAVDVAPMPTPPPVAPPPVAAPPVIQRAPPPPPPVVIAPKEPADAKNPLGSQTIWGGLLTALAPELDKIGNTLMGFGATMGPAILTLGLIMIVLGRIGATQPLSTSAPIRKAS